MRRQARLLNLSGQRVSDFHSKGVKLIQQQKHMYAHAVHPSTNGTSFTCK